ncbi:Mbeg1-like protein [Clostridium sp. C105KSO13]|uniref:Mbeg1-like protein n=1 Tax=Clostridium sp. C105KSO13 TaxID=1776045 RepID=UPI000740815B|nr:Mbeg1-like protein [Clostridium sp. C105KSO13]CUX18289.1 hypothetical protein BN3456_00270 [Clostridium sp. C105KSO13]
MLQHNPFLWIVNNNDFQYLRHLSAGARYTDQTLNRWIEQLSEEERGLFVDSLYTILKSTDLSTFDEFKTGWQTTFPAVAQAAAKMDKETRHFLFPTLRALASLGIKNFPNIFLDHDGNS